MKFELTTPTTVRLEQLHIRRELHGEESVPAIDLHLSWEGANDRILAMFDAQLLAALYRKPAGSQQHIEGAPPVMSELLFEALAPLRWRDELTGYTLVVDYGTGGKSNLTLADVTLDRFLLDLRQGGTVKLGWRARTSRAGERELGKLPALIDADIPITQTAAKLQGTKDNPRPASAAAPQEAWPFPADPPKRAGSAAPAPGSAAAPAAGKRGAKAKDATQTFLDQHGKGARS